MQGFRAWFVRVKEKTLKQSTLDRIRVFNKHVTNKILVHISGRRFGHFAILGHVGRKSGKLYRIPIIAEPVKDGFVIALTYGKKVDWYENVMAKGSCSLHWKNRDYLLVNPQLVDPGTGLTAFPPMIQSALKRQGIEYFLKLHIQQ
jgi:deazaflavin-dependent oxidoreductase (nitroreductase family)